MALWQSAADTQPDSFWVSLRFFNIYRLLLAAVFLAAVTIFGDSLNFGSHNLAQFKYVSAAYLLLAVAFQVLLERIRRNFNFQLSMHVIADIVATVLLMNASDGFRSGLGVMLLISLAAAALVSRGALMLFYAALASIAILLEQTYWILSYDHSEANYVQPGLLSIGYFATALITNQLAQRVIRQERVMRQRSVDLGNQLRISQLVIQDMQDAVLVVDGNGLVRQHNPQVSQLLGWQAPELDQIENYSPEIARALAHWRDAGGGASETLLLPGSGKLVRARFVEAGAGGGSISLVFLEDLSRLQEQAQQLKLAALGRLTANMAHEIRNPLSAISHASELLLEEHRNPSQDRLLNIIQDNSKRLDRMVRDVLELTRRDRVRPETIGLAGFLPSFIDEFAQNERVPRSSFVLQVNEDSEIVFDRVHLQQVLWNLLRNAWRHSRQGEASVRLIVGRRANRVELNVIDDGEGVPTHLRQQLFEPFFTTYSSGTGLGLYIAREMCAANSAILEYVVSPSDEGGADFRVVCGTKPA
ncbi:MAG: HAMP domain-containing histidine kinase [Burkholderiales bacterium]|nr:HAMP domain-containing histidine kinase [Burkholderiales bacterium]